MKRLNVCVYLAVLLCACVVNAKDRDYEKIFAELVAQLGTNRLAADAGDAKGKKLIDVAFVLDPENETALLTNALLDRGAAIETVKSKYQPKELAVFMAKRAKQLTGDIDKNPKLGILCRLYLCTAELLKPADRTVILELARLNQKGYSESIDDILDQGLIAKDLLTMPKTEEPKPETPLKPFNPYAPQEKKIEVETWGIGDADTFLEKRYGRARGKDYIDKPSEYILHFRHDGRRYRTYVHFGKCRQVKLHFYKSSSLLMSALNEFLGATGKEDSGWVHKKDYYWESVDGELCATYDSVDHYLSIWDKKWYEEHEK